MIANEQQFLTNDNPYIIHGDFSSVDKIMTSGVWYGATTTTNYSNVETSIVLGQRVYVNCGNNGRYTYRRGIVVYADRIEIGGIAIYDGSTGQITYPTSDAQQLATLTKLFAYSSIPISINR